MKYRIDISSPEVTRSLVADSNRFENYADMKGAVVGIIQDLTDHLMAHGVRFEVKSSISNPGQVRYGAFVRWIDSEGVPKIASVTGLRVA